MKIYQAGWALGMRALAPKLSRRALMKASTSYVAVPLALDQILTVVSFGKLNEDVQAFTVLSASIAAAYGPSRIIRAAKTAIAMPATTAGAAKALSVALVVKGKSAYRNVASVIGRASAVIIPATAGKGRQLKLSFAGYGDMVFELSKGKILVTGSTAFITAVLAGNGFNAVSQDITLDDVINSSLQIMSAVVSEIENFESEEVKEEMMKRDPISLFSSLPLIAESSSREYQYVSRQKVASLAMDALLTDVHVESEMYFDLFVDTDGDAVISIDGTYFQASLPSGLFAEHSLSPVAPAKRSNELPGHTSVALFNATIEMFRRFKAMGNIPFVKADGGFLYSPPHAFSVKDDDFILCLSFSEEGAIELKIFKSTMVYDASENYDAASTRNFFEKIADSTFELGSDIADSLNSAISYFSSWGKGDEIKEAEVVSAESRLETPPGTVSFYTYSEIEKVL